MGHDPASLIWEEFAVQYRVLIEQDEDGVYVAEVPALPGCLSQGKTRSEVVRLWRRSDMCSTDSVAAI